MMKKRTLFFLTGLIAVLWLEMSGEGIAGMVVEQVERDRDGIPAKVSLYFSDYRFRTDHLEGGLTTILDFKKDQLIMMDHRSKSYVEVKLSQWEEEIAKRL